MKHQDLIKGQVYNNILDKDIPLMFTGKRTIKNDMGYFSTIAHFTPVKTEHNKNWFDSIKIYTKGFDNENGNRYITI